MAFTIDRTEASRRLGVSTRTVDRLISSGRIRTNRIGKKIFLHEEDVDRVRNNEEIETNFDDYELILEKDRTDTSAIMSRETQMVNYSQLYLDAQSAIAKKDEIIQDLSYRLGKSETELKNSIPLIDYKQATFLLESAHSKTSDTEDRLSTQIRDLEREVDRRNAGIIGLSLLVLFVLAFSGVFFLYTRM